MVAMEVRNTFLVVFVQVSNRLILSPPLLKLSNMSDSPTFQPFLRAVAPSKFTAKVNEDVKDWLTSQSLLRDAA